jgi:hypothetical protein
VDSFLLERINQSLEYWSSTKINLIGRGVVVNGVLLSSTYFFTSLWGSTQQGVKRVHSAVANYFLSGTASRSREKVSWLQCCQTRKNGGINLINPADAMTALMSKWIVKALESGTSNLHLLLRFRLQRFQPYSGGRWDPSLDYFLLPHFQAKQGSRAWNRVGTAWRSLAKEVTRVKPKNFEEVMSESFGWSGFVSTIGPGFAKNRAAQLHKAGLRRLGDAWHGGAFISVEAAGQRFGLKNAEHNAWNVAIAFVNRFWRGLLGGVNPRADPQEWLGIFSQVGDGLPKVVFQPRDTPSLSIGAPAQE